MATDDFDDGLREIVESRGMNSAAADHLFVMVVQGVVKVAWDARCDSQTAEARERPGAGATLVRPFAAARTKLARAGSPPHALLREPR